MNQRGQLSRAGCVCPALILSSVVCEPVEKGDSDGSRSGQSPGLVQLKLLRKGAGNSTVTELLSLLPGTCVAVFTFYYSLRHQCWS